MYELICNIMGSAACGAITSLVQPADDKSSFKPCCKQTGVFRLYTSSCLTMAHVCQRSAKQTYSGRVQAQAVSIFSAFGIYGHRYKIEAVRQSHLVCMTCAVYYAVC